MALRIRIDEAKSIVTGEYESGTGDDGHGGPAFVCAFRFRGSGDGSGEIPLEVDSGSEQFHGKLRIVNETKIILRFEQEPGGCWNVDPDISGHIAKEGTSFAHE